ncbi:Bug family tripartite tricarboxylate transporter substrate binding protein [Falsiroseomonas sp. HC035]|uniref:Bug family tripartite tricarboxylate transporter substrate binding protein n=1 Tax=Falsiroseomonas sp. HC035 TaxID=3390999 RepID=UPI003D31E0E3
MALRPTRRQLLAAAAAMAARPAAAQADWPSRPIRLVVPFAPGGTTDVMARLLAESIGPRLGQSIIVENRAGAGATVGAAAVARAAPDGYTLLMSNSSSHGVSPTLYPNIPYDSIGDFTHIGLVATSPSVLVVTAVHPARTLRDFLDLAREQREIRFAVAGIGTSSHLAGVRLGMALGVPITAVPYRGAGPAMTDTIAGVVPAMLDSLPSAAQHFRNGSVRALGVTAASRVPAYANLPTMREAGVDLISMAWFGVSAPRDLPRDISLRIATAIQATLRDPRIIERFADLLGTPPPEMAPDAYAAFVEEEIRNFAPLVRQAGLQPS